jgi:hypothetical protein
MDHNVKLPAYMKPFTDRQRLAIELLASKPGLSTADASEALQCAADTIRLYRILHNDNT